MAGDDAQAKARVSAFIESLGLRPMDAGPLSMARALENAGLLEMGLMTHTIKHTNFALGVSVSAEHTCTHPRKESHIGVFVTGGTGHSGSLIVPGIAHERGVAT